MSSNDTARIDSLLEIIASRRSLGLARLKEDAIPHEVIEKMLIAANWAPSNGDTEPWRFQAFTGEGRAKLSELFTAAYISDAEADGGTVKPEGLAAMKDRAFSAPLWISIGMTPGYAPDGSRMMSDDEEIMAVACAVQNLHLMATAAGMIGMWHSKGPSVHSSVAEGLGLTGESKLLGFFWCGYPNVAWPDGERGDWQAKVTWNQ